MDSTRQDSLSSAVPWRGLRAAALELSTLRRACVLEVMVVRGEGGGLYTAVVYQLM